MWDRYKAVNGGVLVVGHGTRLASGVEQLLDLSRQIGILLPGIPTEPSFLELAQPTIPQGIDQLQRQGVKQILVVPILLFEAAHALADIPETVHKAANEDGIAVLGQSAPLGTHAAALGLSDFRFQQALRCSQPKGCLIAGGCEQAVACIQSFATQSVESDPNYKNERIGLAMVGRGTSDQSALDHMLRFTELRVGQSQTPISWVDTGFFAGGQTTVDELLHRAAHSDCDTIVVQPHLLFEGELMRQLRAKVQEYQVKSSNRRWLVPPTLGADPKLATAFVSLASETLRERVAIGDL